MLRQPEMQSGIVAALGCTGSMRDFLRHVHVGMRWSGRALACAPALLKSGVAMRGLRGAVSLSNACMGEARENQWLNLAQQGDADFFGLLHDRIAPGMCSMW